MSTDRELLELAAKAKGLVGYRYCDHWRGMAKWNDSDGGWFETDTVWNPCRDDGDALRLAVRLGMKLSTNLHHRFVMVNDKQEFYDEAKFGGVCDPDGVMRRTIVQVAADIGRSMP